MDPDDPRANNGLGLSLRANGSPRDAIPYFQKATSLHPTFAEAWYSLGSCLLEEHRLAEAIAAWQHAIAVRPVYFQAHEGLGFAFYLAGQPSQALAHLRLALDGEPDRVPVLILAASLMATSPEPALRNGPEAVALAERARDLSGGQDITVLDTLSAAYAEAGRFSQATATAQQALILAESQSDAVMVNRFKAHLAKYEAYQPVRDPPDEGTL
jgi:tetratricopeptide (TPR) repeat protein